MKPVEKLYHMKMQKITRVPSVRDQLKQSQINNIQNK